MDGQFSRQLKKGVLDMLVLSLVEREECYGYQIIGELDKRTDGTIKLKEGTLYPVLYRLQDAGLIVAQRRTGAAKSAATGDFANAAAQRASAKEPARKYYAITAEGRAALAAMKKTWNSFSAYVDTVIEEDA